MTKGGVKAQVPQKSQFGGGQSLSFNVLIPSLDIHDFTGYTPKFSFGGILLHSFPLTNNFTQFLEDTGKLE